MKVYKDLEGAVILCHESYSRCLNGDTFCHRHMIARWLEEELWRRYEIKIEIPELV